MKTNLKLKEVYLLSSEKSTLISSVEHSIDISNFNKEIIENTLIHFKNPNTVENILCTVSNKDEYISFINTVKKYNFFTEILKDPMLDNKITIISYEKYIGKIEYGLRKIGIRNVESIGLEHIDKEINRIKVSDNTTTLLYLPNHPRHAYDLLYNYHNHNIKSIIFGHVHLDEIWNVFLDAPRTACPRCLSIRLHENLPLFRHIINSSLTVKTDKSLDLGINILLESINSLYNNYHSDENPQIAGFLNVINLRKMIIKREQVIRKADCFCLKKNQISKLENLVGSHVGIVRSIGQVKLDQTDPNIVLLSGKTGGDFAVDGGALDWNWDRCKVRAISECIERYCWKNYRHNIIFTSWDDLNENERIPINYFNIYSEEQYKDNKFPYKYFEEDKMMDWIPMYRIRDNKKIYVPAEIILANPGINIGIISPRTSTGVAAGGSKQFAIKYAVLELIERDTVSRNLLMNKDIFLLNSRELRRCKSYRRCLEVNLNPEIYFLKNKFNIPVIMCRLVPQDTEDSIISYGFASGTDFITTIDKAIMESILMRIYIRSKLKDEKNISETNGALFNLRNSKESFFENISFNNSDDINEFNIEYDINDVYKSNDIYYHDITMNDAELVNISVVATWSPSMLDFVESKDLAPLNILKCDVKDLIDGKLPF